MRFKLTIAYDGAPFKGWAKQPGLPTIQESIENSLSEICKEPVLIHGSGRTDTGVHAHAQVAHYDAPANNSMKSESWIAALNSKLPRTIRIMNCEEVSEDFHARFSAQSKTYLYQISTEKVLPPHQHQRVWHIPRALDLDLLKQALDCYLGEHDFRHLSALRGNETEETSYRRTITRAEIVESEAEIALIYTGNGFLYKMVRILTGVAAQVAQERIPLTTLEQMLNQTTGDHSSAKYCAPSDGLYLHTLTYE